MEDEKVHEQEVLDPKGMSEPKEDEEVPTFN